MLRFFVTKLPLFLKFTAPTTLSPQFLESLSFLICCGPTYTVRAPSLAYFFPDGAETGKLLPVLSEKLLPKDSTDLFGPKVEGPQSSPLAYRPPLPSPRSSPLAPMAPPVLPDAPLLTDRPLIISTLVSSYQVEEPNMRPHALIFQCKNSRVYINGVTGSVNISHCKDSTIFIGGATSVFLDYCTNVTLVVAAKTVHYDMCSTCTSYLLVNSRPVLSGHCTKLVFAPYNALYYKLGADLLSLGINPALNKWSDPWVLSSLASTPYSILPPALFSLFVVPFTWARASLMFSVDVPPEYASVLEEKKAALIALQVNLERIKNKDPDLAQRIVDSIRKRASECMEQRGDNGEIAWLCTI